MMLNGKCMMYYLFMLSVGSKKHFSYSCNRDNGAGQISMHVAANIKGR